MTKLGCGRGELVDRLVQAHALRVIRLAMLLHDVFNHVTATVGYRDERTGASCCIWPTEGTTTLSMATTYLINVKLGGGDGRRVERLILKLPLHLLQILLELLLRRLKVLLLLLHIRLLPMHYFLQSAHRVEELLAQVDD